VVNFKTVIQPVHTKFLLLLTYVTLQTIVNNHPKVFEVHKHLDKIQVVQNLLNFLSSKTEKGGRPFLVRSVHPIHERVSTTFTSEDMNLSE
jgi:hypothetical protein